MSSIALASFPIRFDDCTEPPTAVTLALPWVSVLIGGVLLVGTSWS